MTPSTTNCTAPVGVPVLGAAALTVAVKVTVWPKVEVALEVVSAAEVGAAVTVNVGA